MEKPKIGIIGLGIMGLPMSKNLLKNGYELVVHNRSSASVDALVSLGAESCNTPAEVAKESDIVITMLPDSPDVEEVALGDNGIIEGADQNTIYIDMSTIAPMVSQKVAKALSEKGIACIDAPVSGGEVGAINATLSIMAGGDENVFNEVYPVFETLGKTIILCGPNGAGQTVKACNQIQVAMNFIGMAEAFVLGAKAGVDPEIIMNVLSGGYAQTRVMDVRGPSVINGDFTPGFKSKFHYKDLNIIMKTGKDHNVPLPVTSIVHELYGKMIAEGRGDLDHSGIITVIEDLAGIQARTKQNQD